MMKKFKVSVLAIVILMSAPSHAQNLNEIYQQVLQSDPRLLIDSLGVEVGVAREQQALGALLPQLSVNSSWTENNRVAEGSSTDSYAGERYTLSVRQSLLNLPKYYGWKKAEDIATQFEYQRENTHSNVKLDTIERYFQLLNARDELILVREEKNSTQKKAEQTRSLYEKQLVKITELYEVEARVDLLSSEEIDALQVLDLAKEGLSELTNNPVDDISSLIASTDFIQRVENIDEWIISATQTNASLRVLQKEIDAAQINIKQQKSAHYPVLELQLSKQKSNIGFENSLSSSTTTGVASLNFSMPIYSGGQTSGRIYEASQQLALSQAKYEQEHRKVIKQLRDMFLGVNAMVRRIEAANKSIKSAQKSYQAMNKSFQLGIAVVSDVLDAQQVYSQAKQNHQQAKYDYIIHKARLLQISGKLDNDVFYEICKWLI